MKVYEVFIIDIWSDIELIGFFKNLDDAIDGINRRIFDKKYHLEKGDLKEYISTLGVCFDTTVGDIYYSKHQDVEDDFYNEEDANMSIRGFILDSKSVLKDIIDLEDK